MRIVNKLSLKSINPKYAIAYFLYALLSLTCVGLTIYPDSYQYYKSANVLFTRDFAEGYQFVREPGYPLIIRMIQMIVDSLDFNFEVILISLQSAMLFGAALALIKAFDIEFSLINILIVIIGILNPVFFSLSGQFLQTSALILSTSICAYCIRLVLKNRYLKSSVYFFIGITSILAFSIGLQVGILYVIPLAILIVRKIINFRNFRSFTNEFILALIILGVVVVWQNYKNAEAERSNLRAVSPVLNSFQLISLDTFKLDSRDFMVFSNIISFNLDQQSEIELLAHNSLGENYCGVWYPTQEAYIAKIMHQNISNSCKNNFIRDAIFKSINFGMILYKSFNVFYLISILYFLFTRKFSYFLITSPSLILHLEYTLINFNIDRYGAPLYLFGLMASIVVLPKLLNIFKKILRPIYYRSHDF